MICEHLADLEKEIMTQGIKETYRGQAWGENCREWVYFDCYLHIKSLRKRFRFPDFIIHHTNDDTRSGLEEGFVCTQCNDGIMGLHWKHRKKGDSYPVIS
jgi:hypothetical protein